MHWKEKERHAEELVIMIKRNGGAYKWSSLKKDCLLKAEDFYAVMQLLIHYGLVYNSGDGYYRITRKGEKFKTFKRARWLRKYIEFSTYHWLEADLIKIILTAFVTYLFTCGKK